MYFKYLFLLVFLPIFAFANPPLKKVKPNAADVAKNKGKSKLKPAIKPNAKPAAQPTLKPKPGKPAKPGKAENHAKPDQKDLVKPGQKELVNPSHHESPKPHPHVKPNQNHKPNHDAKPDHQEAKPNPKLHPKQKHRDHDHQKNPPRRSSNTTASSGAGGGGVGLLGMFLGGCRPDSGLRLSMGKSFGIGNNQAENPLDGVTVGLGYRLLFLNLMAETQISSFSDTKVQAARAHASINIPVGCFSISPLGGVSVSSNNIIESRLNSYDAGLMVEFHVIQPIALGFRYLANLLQNDSKDILHSFTFHFAFYF
jgi:hypothetical protein